MYPTISDGIVLTGFSMNASFAGYFGAGANFEQANLNQPFRLGNLSSTTVEAVLNMYSLTDYVAGLSPSPGLDYPAGYLTNANIGANQFIFFLPGFFDPGVLLVGENTKQPVTVGELLTLTSVPMENVYAGPVLVITGCKNFRTILYPNSYSMLILFQPTTCPTAEVTVLQPATHLFPRSRQQRP